jgi:outer membrane receptor protein involved in Fe transport
MHRTFVITLALVASPLVLSAQQKPVARPPADSARADSARARAHDLNAVTIVAAPVDRSEPSALTHVTASVIRQTPANNTWDMLRQTAGLEVHEQGQGPGFASDASLRGFSSDHSTDLALWIDGVPVNEAVNGHAEGYNDFSVLFNEAVRDIDVIKGPTSPLFGNFAMSGVVNVRTLERMQGSELTAGVGSYGEARMTAMTGFDHGPRGGGVFGVHAEREDGFRPNSGYNLLQGHARVVHQLWDGASIDVGAELYGTDWNSAGFLGEDEFAQHQYGIVSNPSDGGFKRRAQERASLRLISGNMLWRTTVYSTQGRWQLFLTIPPAGGQFEGSGSQTEEEDWRYGLGATSALTWELPTGELTIGGETRYDHSRYENYYTTTRARDSVNVLATGQQLSGALFVQSHTDVTDRLRVDVGARADILDTRSILDLGGGGAASAGVVSPKAGASYRLVGPLSAYANVSRGFRSTDGVITDPTLPLITAWAYEGGFKYDEGATYLSAALFRMNVSNEQTFDPISRGSNSGGASRRQGLELEWRYPVAPTVRLTGDWTFNDARYTHQTIVSEDDNEPPQAVDGLRVYNTARYIGASAVEWAPRASRWALRVSGNWVGPYSPFDEPGVVLGAYGLMHVDATLHAGVATLDLGVRNVLDRAYPELVAGHLVAPGQPRSFMATLRYPF